jgi:hypothetical protein
VLIASAAHRAVLRLDGDQLGGRLGRPRGPRHRERTAAAWRRDQIGGQRGQRIDGAGGQRRAHPLVELAGVEPAVSHGGPQQLDNLVAVRIRRAQRR